MFGSARSRRLGMSPDGSGTYREAEMSYYTVYKDAQGYWRWNLKAANHEIVASGEGYYNKEDCYRAIAIVKASGNSRVYEQ